MGWEHRLFVALTGGCYDAWSHGKAVGVTGGAADDDAEERADLYVVLPDDSLGLKLRHFEAGKRGVKVELKLRLRVAGPNGVSEQWVKVLAEKLKFANALDPNDLDAALRALAALLKATLTGAAKRADKDTAAALMRAAALLPAPNALVLARVDKQRRTGDFGAAALEQTDVRITLSQRLLLEANPKPTVAAPAAAANGDAKAASAAAAAAAAVHVSAHRSLCAETGAGRDPKAVAEAFVKLAAAVTAHTTALPTALPTAAATPATVAAVACVANGDAKALPAAATAPAPVVAAGAAAAPAPAVAPAGPVMPPVLVGGYPAFLLALARARQLLAPAAVAAAVTGPAAVAAAAAATAPVGAAKK